MTLRGYRCLVAVLVASLVVFVMGSGWLFWNFARLTIEVALAEEQTAIFEQIREQALGDGPATAVGCLEYVVGYYPSGTKQRLGSRLDRVVERARARAVAEILAQLRRTTGEDLGDAPERWIEKYRRP